MKFINYRRIAILLSMALFALIAFGAGYILGQYLILNQVMFFIKEFFHLTPGQSAVIWEKGLRMIGEILKTKII